MNKKTKTAITPIRSEDFPNWYQSIVKEADLAEMAHVRGCMVIKPWGFSIWENIQTHLGKLIKKESVKNAYFPLFIPLSYIQKEANHVDGFAKEMAVVTHHRLEKKEDELIPAGKLTEPVVVRPTSEAIIGESFSSWVNSYRDLPIKINQWCNVVRWEMRTRVFLRTSEFLWQEGHCVFSSGQEARDDAKKMIKIYEKFINEYLAIPLIVGTKPDYDRFPGAEITYTVEAMMQDKKALQAGTSHYLGQSFSKSADISFIDKDNESKLCHSSSWGVSTRLIGGLIMTHSDDNGLRLPPKIAGTHLIIIPFLKGKDEAEDKGVLDYANLVKDNLLKANENNNDYDLEIEVDSTDKKPSDKKWEWVKKGVPLIVEVGSRDIENKKVVVRNRLKDPFEKDIIDLSDLETSLISRLNQIQETLYNQASQMLNDNIVEASDFSSLEACFKNEDLKFVKAYYDSSLEEDKRLKELKISVRCIPLDQDDKLGVCILSGNPTSNKAIFAKSY